MNQHWQRVHFKHVIKGSLIHLRYQILGHTLSERAISWVQWFAKLRLNKRYFDTSRLMMWSCCTKRRNKRDQTNWKADGVWVASRVPSNYWAFNWLKSPDQSSLIIWAVIWLSATILRLKSKGKEDCLGKPPIQHRESLIHWDLNFSETGLCFQWRIHY